MVFNFLKVKTFAQSLDFFRVHTYRLTPFQEIVSVSVVLQEKNIYYLFFKSKLFNIISQVVTFWIVKSLETNTQIIQSNLLIPNWSNLHSGRQIRSVTRMSPISVNKAPLALKPRGDVTKSLKQGYQ